MRRALDSIDTVLDILESLENSGASNSVRKIAEDTGITKSTVHRILQDLSSIGWAYQDTTDKNYYIGLKFLAFANEWRMNIGLVKQFDPILREISEKCGQTSFINIIDGEKTFCLHKVESNNIVRVASEIGKEHLFYAGASGKLLLAFAPEWLVKKILSAPLEAFTPFTITDPDIIREQLNEIRNNGYCASVEEVDPGVAAISVPSINKEENIILSVSVAGTRFDYERDHKRWLLSLQEATQSIIPVAL